MYDKALNKIFCDHCEKEIPPGVEPVKLTVRIFVNQFSPIEPLPDFDSHADVACVSAILDKSWERLRDKAVAMAMGYTSPVEKKKR